MVLCAIFGCGTRTVRGKRVYMARIPSVVTNQGEEIRILSEERRKKWISAISRKDATDSILYSYNNGGDRPTQLLSTCLSQLRVWLERVYL